MAEPRTPGDEVRRLYEDAESRTARAFEEVVGRDAFGELLARSTENILAVTKLGTDAVDLVVRNLRIAGRNDITSLARQLARTEDKLERILQEVEHLQGQVAAEAKGSTNGAAKPDGPPAPPAPPAQSAPSAPSAPPAQSAPPAPPARPPAAS